MSLNSTNQNSETTKKSSSLLLRHLSKFMHTASTVTNSFPPNRISGTHPASLHYAGNRYQLLAAANQAAKRKSVHYRGALRPGEELHIANMEIHSAYGHEFKALLKLISKNAPYKKLPILLVETHCRCFNQTYRSWYDPLYAAFSSQHSFGGIR